MNMRESSMRAIRSFVRRAGRSSPAQVRVLEQDPDQCRLKYPLEGCWETWFSRTASKKIIEIGFGMGDALLHYARQAPETDFLGLEVHAKGVAKVLLEIERLGLSNVRVCMHDSLEVLEQLAEHSIDAIHIFFPDPWHKKRHHKRRLIQAKQLALFSLCLKEDGLLHLATDWEPYAEQMLASLNASEHFSNTVATGYSLDRAGRPITKFEKRGLKLGHTIRDLRFTNILNRVDPLE